MSDRNHIDRRRHRRIPTTAQVAVHIAGTRVEGYTATNVSRSGLFLLPGSVMFFEGMELDLELTLQLKGAITLRRPARVVFCSRYGMGLAFTSPRGHTLARADSL